MARRRFQQDIVTGRFSLAVTVVFGVLIWGIAFGVKPDNIPSGSYHFWQQLLGLLPTGFIGEIISVFVYGIMAYMLIEVNNAYSVIRLRTSFQSALFIMLVSACPFLFPLQAGSFVGLCFLTSVYLLFRTYQQKQPVGSTFHSFLFFGIGTLLFPALCFYYPLFLIGAYSLKSLTFRTFFAGLLGLTLPYWFLFGHAYFYGQMELFYAPFSELVNIAPVNYTQIGVSPIIAGIFIVLFFIIATLHFWITSYQDKIRTRTYLNFFVLVTVGTIVFVFLQPQHINTLFPIMLTGSSILIGHLFAVTTNKLSNVLFVLFIVLLVALTFYNLWML